MTISKYIEQDLESRIRAGAELPMKLTVGAIADSYGVSQTPVRLALECLIDKNLVVKQENGRLRLPPVAGVKAHVAPPSKPVDWESVLANELLLMSLRGEDGFVREELMAEKHGIGRTPLRRVLHRLSGGGLIEHIPRRGWRVQTFRQADMDAFIDIRETLEVKALDLARSHLVQEDLERMVEGNSATAVSRSRIDNDLHDYFVKKSGNRYIISFFDSHGGYYTALFDYAALGAEVVSEMAGQHIEILNHVIARRWSKARRSLASHIRAQKPVMQKVITILEADQE
ncbi:MAG: GntR family transcriptional regulator [Rhodothermales bacterium]|nr:GntR family transcriptional regulator [Rhodothermales bacterium]